MKKILSIGLFASLFISLSAQTVTNLVAKQVGKTVEITYDIDRGAEVSIEGLLYDKGSALRMPLSNLEGDMGRVTPGRKKVIWHLLDGSVKDYEYPEAQISVRVKREPQEKITFLFNGMSFTMVLVKEGSFRMGGTPDQGAEVDNDEFPTRDVHLSSFYIGQTEVTQGLWKAVMGATQREQWQRVAPSRPFLGEGTYHPMYYISWNECQVLAQKLTTALQSQIPGMKFTLPTEAQWEYAARGGHKPGPYQYRYSGSDIVGSVAWYGENSGNTTHPVASKSPNTLGIYDMSGNLFEWVQDWYGNYNSAYTHDPSGPETGQYKVYRGGCWLKNECRVAKRRGDFRPGSVSCGLGCRLALVPTGEGETNNLFSQAVISNTFSISAHEIPNFSDYAKPIVEKAINEWQKKGEFEKISDWKNRVNETTRNAKIKELTQQCERNYLAKYSAVIKPNVTLKGMYDSENEVFLLSDPTYGNMLVAVPISDAQTFKHNWSSARLTPKYFIDNDILALASLDIYIPATQKHYSYSNQASLTYEYAQVNYNFNPIEIASENSGMSKGQQTIGERQVSVGLSQVDLNIPKTNASNPNSLVVIISNEHYQEVSDVPYAIHDGETFYQYCVTTLGVPERQVRLIKDATLNNMRKQIKWLVDAIATMDGQANVIVYYAGHGIPSYTTQKAYLLPTDGFGDDEDSAFPLDEMYSQLSNTNANRITVFLDACFSGTSRDGQMLVPARAAALVVRKEKLQGNMLVFSATSKEQTAYPYTEMAHGLYTYYLLKKLQETKGDVSMEDLVNYVQQQVSRHSVIVNSKIQSPTINASPSATDWQTWKLK